MHDLKSFLNDFFCHQFKESALRKQSLYLKFDPLLRESPKKSAGPAVQTLVPRPASFLSQYDLLLFSLTDCCCHWMLELNLFSVNHKCFSLHFRLEAPPVAKKEATNGPQNDFKLLEVAAAPVSHSCSATND